MRIPTGTLLSVCRTDDARRQWHPHTTHRELVFDAAYRTREVHGSSGAVVFRYGDWLILTRWDKVNGD